MTSFYFAIAWHSYPTWFFFLRCPIFASSKNIRKNIVIKCLKRNKQNISQVLFCKIWNFCKLLLMCWHCNIFSIWNILKSKIPWTYLSKTKRLKTLFHTLITIDMTIIQNSVGLINNHVSASVNCNDFSKKKSNSGICRLLSLTKITSWMLRFVANEKTAYPFFAITQIQAIAFAIHLMYVVVCPFSRIIYVPP